MEQVFTDNLSSIFKRVVSDKKIALNLDTTYIHIIVIRQRALSLKISLPLHCLCEMEMVIKIGLNPHHFDIH